jgi:hypothetical protein
MPPVAASQSTHHGYSLLVHEAAQHFDVGSSAGRRSHYSVPREPCETTQNQSKLARLTASQYMRLRPHLTISTCGSSHMSLRCIKRLRDPRWGDCARLAHAKQEHRLPNPSVPNIFGWIDLGRFRNDAQAFNKIVESHHR